MNVYAVTLNGRTIAIAHGKTLTHAKRDLAAQFGYSTFKHMASEMPEFKRAAIVLKGKV